MKDPGWRWWNDAQCLGKPTEMWSVASLPKGQGGARRQHARSLCSGCPVRVQCLEDALSERLDVTAIVGTFEEPDVLYETGFVRGGEIFE
ncbi:WhiB family transcriptional regulator [Rhodococcus jostii]|uniref:WhiB family transcriptional regulator n=1 Tax=Rhodococcus jostii TaxID=132919 RepID=UPI00362F5B17